MPINKIDKFFNHLSQFEWYSPDFLEISMQCIDKDNLLKDISYSSLKEAFLAGEELAVLIHQPACGYEHDDAIFIDNIIRPACNYENTQPIGKFDIYLVNCLEDAMVLTIQSSLQIKRFGITSGTHGMPTHFYENPLHPDITNAMHKLMEKFS